MVKQRHRKKDWAIVVSLAILIHLVLFLSIKQSFFSAFKKTIRDDTRELSGVDTSPMAIITIPIEIEPETEDVADPKPEKEKDRVAQDRSKSMDEASPKQPLEIENLVGEGPATLPHNAAPVSLVITPRPVEIVWPDTRRLRDCLGHEIDVKIYVGENGDVLKVVVDDEDHPPECIRAALESARRTVFEPGKINGVEAKMWTQVRIEFRRKG
jgi:hypothetical protein